MKEVAKLLNDMVASGVISDYAVFGAIAQMRYTEAVATLDADILIAVPDRQRLDVLAPVYEFCARLGYRPEGEAIRVGAWPVQFVPVFDELTEAALGNAEAEDIEGIPFRAVRADYLAAIALSVGRPKDFARVLALLESEAVSGEAIESLCAVHGLSKQWHRFKTRFLEPQEE